MKFFVGAFSFLLAVGASHAAITLTITGADSFALNITAPSSLTPNSNFIEWNVGPGTAIGTGTVTNNLILGASAQSSPFDAYSISISGTTVNRFALIETAGFGIPGAGAVDGGSFEVSDITGAPDLTTLDWTALEGVAVSGVSVSTDSDLNVVGGVPEPSPALMALLPCIWSVLRRNRRK